MVFGHGVWNDVFNYETFPSGHTLSSIRDDYLNCVISNNLAIERLRDLESIGRPNENEAMDIINDWGDRDCDEDPIYGCTDPEANNYDPDATMEAIYFECRYDGCTDRDATNYDPRATDDDGSCIVPVPGCMDEDANNYNEDATVYDPMFPCTYDDGTILGCMDETANNYNAEATKDDGLCTYDVVGCMDETACNYDATANIDGEDCKYGDECGALDGLEDWHLIAGAILLVVLLK